MLSQSPSSILHGAGHVSVLSAIYQPLSYVAQLNWADLFPKAEKLEIELGSGDGSFLIRYAQAHPELSLLGVERLMGRLRKIARKAARASLTNVKAIRIEASYFMEYLVPAGTVAAVHIYFPDPWPKKRHHRRRLVNQHFTGVLHRALQAGGRVYLRTDDASYAEQMRAVMDVPGFEPVDTPPDLLSITTDFEADFVSEGRPIYRRAYEKRAEQTTHPRSPD